MSSGNLPDAPADGVANTVVHESSCIADNLVDNNNNSHGNCSGVAADDDDDSAIVVSNTNNNYVENQPIVDVNDSETITHVSVTDNSSSNDSGPALQNDQRGPIHRNSYATPQVGRDSAQRSNYTSAHMSTLGNDSDRMDFYGRSQLAKDDDDDDEQGERSILSEEDDAKSVVSLKKIREWFSTSSSPGNDTGACNGDYHEFGSQNKDNDEVKNRFMTESNPTTTKTPLDRNEFDETLLNGTRGKRGQNYRSIRPWIKQTKGIVMRNHPPPLVGTEEEERVMGECSFFYNNMDESDMVASQQIMNGTRSSIAHDLHGRDDSEKEDGYLDHPQDLHHVNHRHRPRLLHPRTISNVIKTRAKRQWTERRYRRRLRQSQLGMVSFDGIANSNDTSPNNNTLTRSRRLRARQGDDTSYLRTKEHQRAFLAAHFALNGKLAYETNGYNNSRRNTAYDYDIDDDDYYDLELAMTQSGDEETGEETRAYVTKSSLAIRGGLIRLPTDNVRLVCDPMLQPGILSIETRELTSTKTGGGRLPGGYENFGNANRNGNIQNSSGKMMLDKPLPHSSKGSFSERRRNQAVQQEHQQQQVYPQQQHWSRQELAYVLTVDERIYQRVVQEMGDSYRIPCGMYYCCHVTTGGDHVGIGVAVAILSVLFLLLIAGMIAWPTV
ncbi:hypothetical protein ACHAXH_000806 [Discostella pseudostelligera]